MPLTESSPLPGHLKGIDFSLIRYALMVTLKFDCFFSKLYDLSATIIFYTTLTKSYYRVIYIFDKATKRQNHIAYSINDSYEQHMLFIILATMGFFFFFCPYHFCTET